MKKFEKCYKVAFAYHFAADAVEDHSEAELRLVPLASLRAFSVELIIKAGLLAETGKVRRVHELYNIYDDLSEDVKTRASRHFQRTCQLHLREFLISESKTFEEWRYAYEKDSLKSHPGRLREAFTAILDALQYYRAEFKPVSHYSDLVSEESLPR